MKAIKYEFGDNLHKDSKLTFLFEDTEDTSNKRKGFFLCQCGDIIIRPMWNVKNGQNNMCRSCKSRKHGLHGTKAYICWKNLVARCCNPKNPQYYNYGGRGIDVASRWLPENNGLINFYEDMGEPSDGLSLDRIDVNKGYSKENCRWADWETQANNKRKTKERYDNVYSIQVCHEEGNVIVYVSDNQGRKRFNLEGGDGDFVVYSQEPVLFYQNNLEEI